MAKKRRPLTQAERDAIDEEIFSDGGFEIIRDGQRLRMRGDGTFVPITGTQAQQRLKKKRKPKTTQVTGQTK